MLTLVLSTEFDGCATSSNLNEELLLSAWSSEELDVDDDEWAALFSLTSTPRGHLICLSWYPLITQRSWASVSIGKLARVEEMLTSYLSPFSSM